MRDLYWCAPSFNPQGYIVEPIDSEPDYIPDVSEMALFDQNGYDLTELERRYYNSLDKGATQHRNKYHHSLRRPWALQHPFDEAEARRCLASGDDPFAPEKQILRKSRGAVLNHAFLLERKGYQGEALEQLKRWAKANPMVYKLINMRPKRGIDFSIDYVGEDGTTFEIFHYEWDSFDYNEADEAKRRVEEAIRTIDWEASAEEILRRRTEWEHLDYFGISDWRCEFFGLGREKYKMLTWSIERDEKE